MVEYENYFFLSGCKKKSPLALQWWLRYNTVNTVTHGCSRVRKTTADKDTGLNSAGTSGFFSVGLLRN